MQVEGVLPQARLTPAEWAVVNNDLLSLAARTVSIVRDEEPPAPELPFSEGPAPRA